MNHNEIIDALSAVRSAGHEFTKSFNHLSDIIEAMAQENESLHARLKHKDHAIAERDSIISDGKQERDTAVARATKAEQDAWDMAQSLDKTKNRVQELERFNDGLGAALTNAENELAELRPMRQQRDIAFADLTTANGTIVSLRQEVSKLLEIILNVATSVDGVVNKPKTDGPTPPCEGLTGQDWESAQALMDPDTGGHIPNRHYPRSAA